jgi:peptidyl-prolyl cis-trans isomerase SurA
MSKGRIALAAAMYAFFIIAASVASSAYAVEVNDRVVAIVNDDVITLSELNAEGGDSIKGDPSTVLKNGMTVGEARDNVLEQIIMRKLLDQAVKENGLDITQIDVDRAIAEQLKMNGMSKQDLLQFLAKKGMTYEEYRAEVEYSIKKERLISKKLSSHIIVSDEEIAAYFKEHEADFKGRKEFRISEIVFAIPPDATEGTVVELRNRADTVYKKLIAGASFDSMAKEYSMAPDAEKGGDMGFIQPSTLDPGFVALLNKMDVGQISEVIGTESGFIIFKITEAKPITNITVDDVRSEIEAIIRRDKTVSYFESWMKDLRAAAFVQKML